MESGWLVLLRWVGALAAFVGLIHRVNHGDERPRAASPEEPPLEPHP